MANWDEECCMLCGRPTHGNTPHDLCQGCRDLAPHMAPRQVLLGMARRPADAALLTRAIMTLREYVLRDDLPADADVEISDRPKYLTSSHTETKK